MRCLVTGGAGFLGSHVARDLAAAGHEVVVLDDLSGGFEDNVPEGAAFVRGTILDHDLVNRLFEERRFETVYHLAAYAAEGLSHFIRRFNYENNLVGTMNLINASVNFSVKCFVFTSSIAVYGAGRPPMTEDMAPAPEDPYGVAKSAIEMDLRIAHEMFGLDYVVFRPHNVYGENQNIGDRYRNVIGIFMNQIMQGKPLTIFGDGRQTRAFSYVREVSPLIAMAPVVAGARNQVFNIGADAPVSLNDLAREVCEVWGVKPNIVHLGARNEVVHAYASHEKLRRVFPAPERTWTLGEGLERMAAWAKTHGARQSASFKNVEIRKNLPASWE